jgi:hypothetical protein
LSCAITIGENAANPANVNQHLNPDPSRVDIVSLKYNTSLPYPNIRGQTVTDSFDPRHTMQRQYSKNSYRLHV